MSSVAGVALVIVAAIIAAAVAFLVIVVRQAWSGRGNWAEEDRIAGEDTRRDASDKGLPGPLGW